MAAEPGEANGAVALPTAQRQNASEFYIGTSYHPYKYLTAIFGGSLGAFDNAGSTKYRLQAAVRMYFGEGKRRRRRPDTRSLSRNQLLRLLRPTQSSHIVEDHSRIEILEEINFEHNSHRLTRASKRVLDEVADIIHEHKESIAKVHVEGQSSLVGSAPYNEKLSWKRARAVVKYLADVRKVPSKLLMPHGYGEKPAGSTSKEKLPPASSSSTGAWSSTSTSRRSPPARRSSRCSHSREFGMTDAGSTASGSFKVSQGTLPSSLSTVIVPLWDSAICRQI